MVNRNRYQLRVGTPISFGDSNTSEYRWEVVTLLAGQEADEIISFGYASNLTAAALQGECFLGQMYKKCSEGNNPESAGTLEV